MPTTPENPRAVPAPTVRRLQPTIPRPRAAVPVRPAPVARPVVSAVPCRTAPPAPSSPDLAAEVLASRP